MTGKKSNLFLLIFDQVQLLYRSEVLSCKDQL